MGRPFCDQDDAGTHAGGRDLEQGSESGSGLDGDYALLLDGVDVGGVQHRQQDVPSGAQVGLLPQPGQVLQELAGRLIEKLPDLWAGANLEERRELLLTMLDAVYVDAVEEKRIVAIKPRPAFRPLLEIAATREGSGIVLVTERPPDEDGRSGETPPEPPPGGQGADGVPCFWWRRGRVELPVQKLSMPSRRSRSFHPGIKPTVRDLRSEDGMSRVKREPVELLAAGATAP